MIDPERIKNCDAHGIYYEYEVCPSCEALASMSSYTSGRIAMPEANATEAMMRDIPFELRAGAICGHFGLTPCRCIRHLAADKIDELEKENAALCELHDQHVCVTGSLSADEINHRQQDKIEEQQREIERLRMERRLSAMDVLEIANAAVRAKPSTAFYACAKATAINRGVKVEGEI